VVGHTSEDTMRGIAAQVGTLCRATTIHAASHVLAISSTIDTNRGMPHNREHAAVTRMLLVRQEIATAGSVSVLTAALAFPHIAYRHVGFGQREAIQSGGLVPDRFLLEPTE
jgi:hypothetical protein